MWGEIMKKTVIITLLIVCIIAFSIYHYSNSNSVMNGNFNYYPLDPHTRFLQSQTSLQWTKQINKDQYTIKWEFSSTLNQQSFVRQDMSLLYEDGHLIDKITEQAPNTKTIKMNKIIKREDSGHYEAITLHYAQLQDPNGQILSQRQMSYDQLYVTASPFSQMDRFEIPQTAEEKQWKKILNRTSQQKLAFAWNELQKHYHIHDKQFYHFSLPYLHIYDYNRLPGCTKRETEQAVGKLWDLLYRQYFTGIHLANGKTVSPIGSTVPLLLFAKDRSCFIILIQTKANHDVKLVLPLPK